MTFDRAAFFAAVRKDFGRLSQSQVDGFGVLLDAWAGHDPRFTAYALATAYHETAKTMQPIEEYGKGKGRAYGPTGFWGRGFVQLTWRANYEKASTKLGVDFVKSPALIMVPKHAADIMVRGMLEGWFTGKKLADYFNATKDAPESARRIINGTDRAALIAGYHHKFLAALKVAGGASALASVPPPPDIHPIEKPAPAPTSRLWAAIGRPFKRT